MRICLLSYRGNPYSGGQGIYIYYLSRELRDLGHEVHVISGPPYPEVVDGITLHKLESLNLYESPNTFWQDLSRVRNPLRFYEFLMVCLGTLPEMLTFSIRAYNRIRALQPRLKFDVIHDNQCLAYGLLLMKRLNIPVVATIHHPIHIDRQIELDQAESLREKWRLWRWFSFIGMQRRVSPRLDRIITVSRKSADDIQRFFKVPEKLLRVVLNGVDIDFFHGDGHIPREPDSLIMVSSGNGHTKGLPYLLQALHKLRNEASVKLTVVGNGDPQAEPATLVREYGLEDTVRFTGKIKREELASLYATAEIAVVPSLHEGFGFPAAEAMSSQLPIVSTIAGALPEVVGKDGSAGILVPPRDADALAGAVKYLLANKQLGRNMGEAGRKRVVENFSWRQAASQTVQVYEELL